MNKNEEGTPSTSERRTGLRRGSRIFTTFMNIPFFFSIQSYFLLPKMQVLFYNFLILYTMNDIPVEVGVQPRALHEQEAGATHPPLRYLRRSPKRPEKRITQRPSKVLFSPPPGRSLSDDPL
jgi:hypothetical protein